ncbi:hypothetical protein CC86DRAFT_74295 [Ophiobolus disseminans]|uniref:Uncharacterized protein n=1 Tax=Ophiobolus disseminans TaxID=1469910 RepID=A0A6A6ZPF1_9PLEO|nr:hypothetical protein CC86DRAFT_74295 [Ophiobolus disseminans]
MNPQASTFIPTSPLLTKSFDNLPREIRDKIYGNLLQYHTQINIFPTNTIPVLPFLARRLPYSRMLNHQILNEVALVWLARSKVMVEIGAFSTLETLLYQFPNSTAWNSIRELESRGWQSCYANGDTKGTRATMADCIHDIAIRCPGLRKLSMTLLPRAVLQPNWFEESTNLSRLLENERIEHMCLTVDISDRSLPTMGRGWDTQFEECTARNQNLLCGAIMGLHPYYHGSRTRHLMQCGAVRVHTSCASRTHIQKELK